MKVVLIGYMASGKSAVGKLLAKETSLDFIDLDAYIEAKEKKSIPSIFKEKGEIYFRLREAEYLSELLNSKNSFVLSVGGGTPCYGKNMEMINSLTQSIFLKASINTLCKRLKNEKASRPLVAKISDEKLPEFIGKHLFERLPFYLQSQNSIQTDDFTIAEIVSKIKKTLV
ncbi:MAG: shikimate kinase [Urechidicola sp.]|nr:shikimate kinase [Urechidicola sp.]